MSNQTFLPEDYLAQRAERRTNLICLVLFVVVMAGVVGAFLVTNRQWSRVKERRQTVNLQYQQAALQIEELNQLESQRAAMLHKAELAAALVERVPRSILLADLVNRMPPRLGLLEFRMESEKVRSNQPIVERTETTGSLRDDKPTRGRTRAEAVGEARKVEPPRFQVSLELVGVAPTDLEVSKYLNELNQYPLLHEVTLKYSEEKEIEGRLVREFRIHMSLDPEADVRAIDPSALPKDIKDPMNDTVRYGAPIAVMPGDGHVEN